MRKGAAREKRPNASVERFLVALVEIDDAAARKKLIAGHSRLIRFDVLEQLARRVVEAVRVDTHSALRLAEAGVAIAAKLKRRDATALSLRAKANALYACGQNREAVEHHERAVQLYTALENWKEAARTLSSSLQPMILLGEYDRAFAAAERAREIFARLGEPWRLARLDINVGNIFHRQDRFDEALGCYERAYQSLLPYGDAEGVAVVLSNMAVCLIGLNDFPRALATYQKAREFCDQHKMPLLVAQADYNVAYLYYLRGEYSEAIERLYAARQACAATGDTYHYALCHLDLSDVYLELNLSEEAREIAHEGFLRFEKLGMGYEAAKTLANEAIACGQQGKAVQALEGFARARAMFSREKNVVWPWLIDLYQSLLLFNEGRHFEARRLCTAAAAFFDVQGFAGKAALARLLLAEIAMQVGDLPQAQTETDAALATLKGLQSPVLAYQGLLLSGHLAKRRGDRAAALDAYQRARKELETLRSKLRAEELKISFAKNRLLVYEALTDLYLSEPAAEIAPADVFAWIEAAKSRSMTELIFQRGKVLTVSGEGHSGLVLRIRELREELNWYYHRIELEELRPEENSRQRIDRLQEQAQSREKELLRSLRELPAHEREYATLELPEEFSVQAVQAALPAAATLVEYYFVEDRVIAAVLTRETLQILPVTVTSLVAHYQQLLHFQLSKFRMGTSYVNRFAGPLMRAAESHLESLWAELIAPIREALAGTQLIFVPHGLLHFLPFHALRADGRYLCDDFAVSYAPSAAVFLLCQRKPRSSKAGSLVMGLPDRRAPEILAEVQAVASLLPKTELFIGEKATAAVLRERGPECDLVHIATHGVYRQDNPMFSGIRLGDGYLNLYDLYQMRMGARLVTLSGCATGMNVVAAGDELLGLERGLFCAGASSLMLSLWDVHDQSTAELMQHFYKSFIETGNAETALQAAMKQVRSEKPHPYFWAPFVLSGKLTDSQAHS